MARDTINVDAPLHAVYDVLAHPGSTPTEPSSQCDPGFREALARARSVLHHAQMLLVRDMTTVIDSRPANRPLLEARARPVVVSTVDVRLNLEAGGTRVVLEEKTGGLMAVLADAVRDPLLRVRNWSTVRTLKALAEMGVQIGRQPAQPAER